jgi:tetratricopeptide (TPR) repeat protein
VVRLSDGKSSALVTLVSPKDMPIGRGGKKLLGELRWYLEDYLNMPHGAYTELAKDIQEALRSWGQKCFETLFSELTQDWFQEARRNGLENLHLKISSDDPAILSWPWEALYCDDVGFLAQNCCMERQLSNSKIANPLPLSAELPKDKINILYIIPRPLGDRDVGFSTLARPLTDYVRDKKLPVHIDVLRPPTFEQLRSVLHSASTPYHIVHFDGHGLENILFFENDKGDSASVKVEEISKLLAMYNIPVVVLNACRSGMINEDIFASVATSLLQEGVRSVVAMGYILYVSGAKEFVPSFYQCLFETGSMDEAIRAGRQTMHKNEVRDCVLGEHPLQDWIVPVLYQNLSPNEIIISPLNSKAGIEDKGLLPEEVLDIGDYRFIGRERAILALERTVLWQDQAGLLIHGMAGVGKTTLAKGFLQWLNNTNGLENRVFWFDFREVHSFEHILNKLLGSIWGINAVASSDDEKLSLLIKILKDKRYFIVWDNFESASGIAGTEVMPLLTNKEKDKLKNLLKLLRGGKTKILITSRAPENWLAIQNPFRISLGGMQGEEVWEYCNAVVKHLGLKIERSNEEFAGIIKKLDGNPLAIRAILLRLQERSASKLLKELDEDFKGFDGDESTLRIQSVFNLLNRGLDKSFVPILQLIGLHEHYVAANYLEYMLGDTEYQDSCEYLTDCFTVLENAGFCHEIEERVYKMHPALRSCLAQTYPAQEILQKKFVDVMGGIANQLVTKPLHEQKDPFVLNEVNLYKAMDIATNLGMATNDMAITQCLALFMRKNRNFSQARYLYNALAGKANSYNQLEHVAASYHQLGIISEEQKDYQTAESWYKKSLEISERNEYEQCMAATYHHLGIITEEQNDFRMAEIWCKKALDIFTKQKSEKVAETYHQLGTIAKRQRNFQIAESWYKKALKIYLKQDNDHGIACVYENLGSIALEQRDFKSAESWCKKSLKIFKKQGDKYEIAASTYQLGRIVQEQEDFQGAEYWYKKALEILWKQGDECNVISIYYQLGIITHKQKDYQAAESWNKKVLEICEKQGNIRDTASAYHHFGMAAQEQKAFEMSEYWYKKSLEIHEKYGTKYDTAGAYHDLGTLYHEIGKKEIAGQFYLEAIVWLINDKYRALIGFKNFIRLLQSSDDATQEKLRNLWIESGLSPELLDKTVVITE